MRVFKLGRWFVLAVLGSTAACSASPDDVGGVPMTTTPGSAGTSSGSGAAADTGGTKGSDGGAGEGGAAGSTSGSGGATHGAGGDTGGGGSSGGTGPACQSNSVWPADAPVLTPGTWQALNPPGFPFPDSGVNGIVFDPCDPAILYIAQGSYHSEYGHLWKSTDAGSTWKTLGKVEPNWTGTDHIDDPYTIRIDPQDGDHLYVGQGVNGNTQGFWVSTDGGENFARPEGFVALNHNDPYDIAPDPTDFNHVLLSFHGAWSWDPASPDYVGSGILETTDGGATWIEHHPLPGWGFGHSVAFLYEPTLGIGDSATWLLGTQGNGFWRTSDAGVTWDKVSDHNLQHGGGQIYYTRAGVLFTTSGDTNLRSTDNGLTWTSVGPGGGFNGIFGDGQQLYTMRQIGPGPFITSPETDGVTWTDYNAQSFSAGPHQLTFDAANGIMYSASWGSGLLALSP